jgi:hypothetical protein
MDRDAAGGYETLEPKKPNGASATEGIDGRREHFDRFTDGCGFVECDV